MRAYKEFEERVGTIERGRGNKGKRVRAQVLKRTLPFSSSEIEEACPRTSRDMVRVVLRAMKAKVLNVPAAEGARGEVGKPGNEAHMKSERRHARQGCARTSWARTAWCKSSTRRAG